MPATSFKCPNGDTVPFKQCLKHCDHRCMALPALKAVESGTHHWFGKPSVTTLLKPTRQTYLELTTDYSISPFGSTASMIGTSMHTIMEHNVPQNWLSEVRLSDDITSGAFDAYDMDTKTLWDYKNYGAYVVARELGMTSKWEKRTITRGKRKGQEEWKQTYMMGGVKHVHDVAWQMNYYRLLMQKHGLEVKHMNVQVFVRGALDATAKRYGLTQTAYVIPINKISDHWVRLYFKTKYDRLMNALEKKELPPVCSKVERWDTSKSYPDRRCRDFCSVNVHCPYYQENYMVK